MFKCCVKQKQLITKQTANAPSTVRTLGQTMTRYSVTLSCWSQAIAAKLTFGTKIPTAALCTHTKRLLHLLTNRHYLPQ